MAMNDIRAKLLAKPHIFFSYDGVIVSRKFLQLLTPKVSVCKIKFAFTDGSYHTIVFDPYTAVTLGSMRGKGKWYSDKLAAGRTLKYVVATLGEVPPEYLNEDF